MKAIATAYYHRSETSYSFGPMTERQLEKFLASDPTPGMHDAWTVIWINAPALYGTGQECGNW